MKTLALILALLLPGIPALAHETGNSGETTVEEIGFVEESDALNFSNTPLKGIADQIPELKNAVLINKDGDVEYGALFTALKYKGVNFDVGYSPENVLVLAASYDLGSLNDLGVETPILRHVKLEPVLAYGFGRIEDFDLRNSEEHLMIGVNFLDIRFW